MCRQAPALRAGTQGAETCEVTHLMTVFASACFDTAVMLCALPHLISSLPPLTLAAAAPWSDAAWQQGRRSPVHQCGGQAGSGSWRNRKVVCFQHLLNPYVVKIQEAFKCQVAQ